MPAVQVAMPVPEGGGLLDTVSSIGFMAARTERLRFGTGITLLPQRNVVYTAKEFATLDWLSKGRIDFGVGVGWCKEEVIACGYTFEDRGSRCDEYLEVIRRLWTDELASFDGEPSAACSSADGSENGAVAARSCSRGRPQQTRLAARSAVRRRLVRLSASA
ncbi:MAG: LLM class flavin-dependent oxidoreductase [Gammaproteobacteria bacterium]|nr:LLM class flavin-dependent oxidoreductase [Gammaproteobacteria bacterium]